ncbi:AraC family transcriptional regulator [Cohnella luojiensis]|nr:AraC family transcriptional regulator [Cohnella luojiensis]
MSKYFSPTLLTHTHWINKEKFLYDVDTYASWTLFVVEEGSFSYRIRESEGEARFGDLVLCPPHTAFHRKVTSSLTFHFYQFDWDRDETSYGLIKLKDTGRLSSNLDYLKRVSTDEDKASMFEHKSHYLADLLFMAGSQERALDALKDETDPVTLKARLWMERHYSEPINFQKLAGTLGISPVQLTRRFTRSQGVTPISYLTCLRLKRSCDLLLETHLTLDQIARECGYENGFYLSRVFSKRMNMSPSQYRLTFKM